MISYDWSSDAVLWWQAWRDHVKNAKRYPERSKGYCDAALIAQTEYVMALATQLNSKEK